AIGFVLGLCSILVWLTAQLPQFISNVKNQSSEALSIWFLVEWFAGDTLNLLGCLIQGQQLPTTTILAAYFVLMDVIMLLQYIYYGALQARRQRLRAKTSRRRPDALLPLLGGDHDLVLDPHGLHSSSSALRPAATSAGAALSSGARSLTAVLYPAAAAAVAWTRSDYDDDSGGGGGGGGGVGCRFLNCDVALVAGTAMGYLSTCFYLASRVSQIRKNLARKSTEGLSPFMFMLTMSANLCTGISIVLRLRSLEQLKEQLPWMCGTFGTIALDMTLFYQ
ncbi:hypothetical protein VOLCADRAFT_44712, partial [Volvox carteri f. nagariensis]